MAGVPVRVLVADDQELMAAGTAAALDSLGEFELVGLAASATEATELAALTQPDVALVDVHLPGGGEVALDEDPVGVARHPVLAHSGGRTTTP